MTDESGDPNAPTDDDRDGAPESRSDPGDRPDGSSPPTHDGDAGRGRDGDARSADRDARSADRDARSADRDARSADRDDRTRSARAADPRRESAPPPSPEPGSRAAGREASLVTRFRTARSGPLLFIRETLYSALGVLAVGFLLFAISGVWPPMVAVESGSMEPEMQRGDLIFVTAPERFTPDYAHDATGIVTVEVGTEAGYRSFGGNGSVIIYDPPDRVGSPIIHRAHFRVEEGENWYERANPAYLNADDCEALSNCPAPHDGFITKGDANARYDQASNIAGPVQSEWIRGSARLRIPYLGYIRLRLAGLVAA